MASFKCYLDAFYSSSTEKKTTKKNVRVGPPLIKLSGSPQAMVIDLMVYNESRPYYNSFSDLFSVYLMTIFHLNWKLLTFLGILHGLNVRSFELSTMFDLVRIDACFFHTG